jgi:hypothetical protein
MTLKQFIDMLIIIFIFAAYIMASKKMIFGFPSSNKTKVK